jgi:FkbM family methyltransferase
MSGLLLRRFAVAAEQDIDVVIQNQFFERQRTFWPFVRPATRVIVEVGAARPDYLSISASFRALGWKVVAIEPNPAFCAAHKAMGFDVLQYACSDEDRNQVDFYVVDSLDTEYLGGKVSNESFSSLGINGQFGELLDTVRDKVTTKTIKVDVRKLETILAQHAPKLKKIDILAVDVEGWELNVVRGFSLEKYQPKIVILENNFNTTDCATYMEKHGYRIWKHLAPNDIYLRDETAPQA